MNAITRLLTALAFVGSLFLSVACSDDSVDEQTSDSSACIITSAVLGGVPCLAHTIASDGSDSIYEAVLTGANYPLSIDQTNNRIFLQDSLPAGCDISRMTFATFTYQGSSITIRSLATAADTTFNMTDSTDCTLPRLITVNASDGSQRNYTLELTVHKQTGDEMNWQRIGSDENIAALENHKLLTAGDQLYLFGRKANGSVLFISSDKGLNWEPHTIDADIKERTVTLFKNTFYAIRTDGRIASSADGITWSETDGTGLNLLVAGSGGLFCVGVDGFWSSPNGLYWQQDDAETGGESPKTELCGTVLPSRAHSGYEEVLVCGLNVAGNAPAIWRRTIDLSGAYTFPWNFFSAESTSYPVLSSCSMITYDGAALLAGLDTDGTLPGLYTSRDQGRTWLTSEIEAPSISAATSLAVCADEEANVYLVCGGTGEVWRGKLARLGWKTIQKEYYRSPLNIDR
ncbi:MAG: hypothetical protein IJS89_05710 [Bacteroidaceae bacterium]|nr:hypothetical protein [Bacteroidaceae bacterium]